MAWIRRIVQRSPLALAQSESGWRNVVTHLLPVVREISSSHHWRIPSQATSPPAKEANLPEATAEDDGVRSRVPLAGRKTSLKTYKDVEAYIKSIELDFKHAVDICKTLRRLYRENARSPTQHEVWTTKSPGFAAICKELERGLPLSMMNDHVVILDALQMHKVPVTSVIFQKTLLIILDNINKYSPFTVLSVYKNVCFLDKGNPTVANLKLACLEYIMFCFDSKRSGTESVEFLASFVNRKHVPNFLREKFLVEILSKDYTSLSEKDLAQVSWGTCMVNPSLSFPRDLVYDFYRHVSERFRSDWPPDIIEGLSKSYSVSVYTGRAPYLEQFCDRLAAAATQIGPPHHPYRHALLILHHLSNISHLNSSLVKHVASKALASDTGTEPDLNVREFNYLVQTLSQFNFLSLDKANWEFYMNRLANAPQIKVMHDSSSLMHLFTALNFINLGIRNNDIFSNAVDACTKKVDMEAVTPEGGPSELRYTVWLSLLLHQCLTVLCPSYDGLKFSPTTLQRLVESTRKVNSYLWMPTLQEYLGGDEYLLRGCTTRFHHSISYVVVLDMSNRPVDLSAYKGQTEPVNIENIKLKPDEKLLVILEFHPHMRMNYRNVDKHIGYFSLYTRVLEALGHSVVSLSPEKFREVDESQRLAFVAREFERQSQGPSVRASEGV